MLSALALALREDENVPDGKVVCADGRGMHIAVVDLGGESEGFPDGTRSLIVHPNLAARIRAYIGRAAP